MSDKGSEHLDSESDNEIEQHDETGFEDQEFDDWNDENNLEGTGNQCADMANDEDKRGKVEIFENIMCHVGQIRLKGKSKKDNTVGHLQGTGTLVKRINRNTYQMLTSCNLLKRQDEADIEKGHFMLNRNGADQYLRRFKILSDTVKEYVNYDKTFPADNGGDFALVNVRLIKE